MGEIQTIKEKNGYTESDCCKYCQKSFQVVLRKEGEVKKTLHCNLFGKESKRGTVKVEDTFTCNNFEIKK